MKRASIFAGILGVLFAVVYATAGEENLKWHDRNRILVQTGTTDVDVSAADYTSPVALLTIDPTAGHAMHDVLVSFDLDKTTTGFNDVATGTITAIFTVQRKTDGTNWRSEIATVSSAITATLAASSSYTVNLGTVTPTEGARIAVTLGDETTSGDMEFPYSVTYRAPATATFTEVAN